MSINEMKGLVSDICSLNGEKVIYKFVPDESDDYEDLLSAMSEPVEDQMWIMDKLHEENYGMTISDINHLRYKGRNESEMEKYRQEGLQKLAEESDPIKKIDIFYKYARELNEGIKMLDFMGFISGNTRTLLSIEICSNMFDSGKLSLTDMNNCLPWLDISDIYGLSKMLGKEVEITEEELQQVKEEYDKSGKPTVLKDMFG